MRISLITLDFRHFFPTAFVAAGVVCLTLEFASSAGRRPGPGGEPAGCLPKYTLPAMPTLPPRPVQGDGPGQSWPAARQGQDAAPVASFVDGLRGNDAAIKLIVGQGRLLTLKTDIAARGGSALIATGDPTVVDFAVLPNPRMIRLLGKRPGITDLSVVGSDGQVFGFEVQVQFDLDPVAAHLRQAFPNDSLRLTQLRNVVVVEGEARSITEIGDVLRMVEADLESAQAAFTGGSRGGGSGQADNGNVLRHAPAAGTGMGGATVIDEIRGATSAGGSRGIAGNNALSSRPHIINLIRVPGVHQVMLQVRIAELDRTALRQIGADMLFVNPNTGNIYGTNIAGSSITATGLLGLGGLTSAASGAAGPNTTAFGIFPSSSFEILIRALRQNSLLSIMAEPNLVAMNGMLSGRSLTALRSELYAAEEAVPVLPRNSVMMPIPICKQ